MALLRGLTDSQLDVALAQVKALRELVFKTNEINAVH